MLRKKKAFTLVELLLAAGLMTIVFTIVLSIAANVLTTWNRTSGIIKATSQANTMLKMIQEDFECMVLKQDGGAWLQVAYPESVGMLTGSSYSTSDSNVTPLMPPEIMFYSTPIDRPRYTSDEISNDAYSRTPISGSLCAMRYKLAVKSPFLYSSGNSSTDSQQYNAFYGFYRAIIDPQSTFETALGETVQGNIYSSSVSLQNIEDMLYSFWSSGSSKVLSESGTRSTQSMKSWSLSPENLLETAVVDFKVTFTVKYIDPYSEELYDEYAYASIAPGTPFTLGDKLYIDKSLFTRSDSTGEIVYNVSAEDVENVSLAYVDVSVTILTSQGQRELGALMDSGRVDQATFKEIVTANSITVVKKISFMGDTI